MCHGHSHTCTRRCTAPLRTRACARCTGYPLSARCARRPACFTLQPPLHCCAGSHCWTGSEARSCPPCARARPRGRWCAAARRRRRGGRRRQSSCVECGGKGRAGSRSAAAAKQAAALPRVQRRRACSPSLRPARLRARLAASHPRHCGALSARRRWQWRRQGGLTLAPARRLPCAQPRRAQRRRKARPARPPACGPVTATHSACEREAETCVA